MEHHMKRIFIFIIIIVAFQSQHVNAQLLHSFGIKAAYTSADQRIVQAPFGKIPTLRRDGFNVAIYAEWLNTPAFSIVTQCEYAQRGVGVFVIQTNEDGPEEIGRFYLYNRLDYLSIPIFAKITIPMTIIKPYIFMGPRIDHFLGYHNSITAKNMVYDNFTKTTVGASCGVGFDLKGVTTLPILLEGRYNVDVNDSYSAEQLTFRNNSFDVWLGWYF
jgi:hypothetical protein